MLNAASVYGVLENQFELNRNRSLFFRKADGGPVLELSRQTLRMLTEQTDEVAAYLNDGLATGAYTRLVQHVAAKTLARFMEADQFLSFAPDDRVRLVGLYDLFLMQLHRALSRPDLREEASLRRLAAEHYVRLSRFLIESNGEEAVRTFAASPKLTAVPCAEYSSRFQFEMMDLEAADLIEPILDLGCGQHANLVHALRSQGMEAYGMDRSADDAPYLLRGEWLEAAFPLNRWGTILSHMAFSNHAVHHFLRSDGKHEAYVRKYMEILRSLKVGGKFIYTPGIPFLEELVRQNPAFAIQIQRSSSMAERLKEAEGKDGLGRMYTACIRRMI
ncbi:class I SAM-dependent methyltransferase [Gorillibacterium sp. sgz500922]|uniref:class I SAM-dependent methyltransferase n=1 Tax=Gorillibacterium sp. sgz500922 TaxID=3446694 RepID=UPI003F67F6A2